MKRLLSMRAAAQILLALGVFTAPIFAAVAQPAGDLRRVANPVTPTAAGTPEAAAADANGKVENAPPAGKVDPNAPTETEILATNGANFSSQDRVAIFEGDVRVNDPRFQLACDKLTVFLAKSAAAEIGGQDNAGAPGNASPPPAAHSGSAPAAKGAKEPNSPSGGIDHARADGHVIIIQQRPPAKPGEEAKISVGHAAWAEFDNKTGDMVLHGWPRVEQNGNTHVALLESTMMTLHRNNSMDTVGPSRTVIKQQAKDAGGKTTAGTPAAAPTPAAKPRTRGHGATQS